MAINEAAAASACPHQKWHKVLLVNNTAHGLRETGMTATRIAKFSNILYNALAPLNYTLVDTSQLTAARCADALIHCTASESGAGGKRSAIGSLFGRNVPKFPVEA